MTAPLPQSLSRTVLIRATPETVFAFFTDSGRWARWWGAGSTIDPTPGGRVLIRYPNAVEAAGEVLAIDPPRRLVFTFGYLSGAPLPPGASRVTITLTPALEGTTLDLTHEFGDAAARDAHVQGWRYQLAVFANTVSDEVTAGAVTRVDAWFEAWTVADAAERRAALARIAAPDVSFRDRFSLVQGLDDLGPHIGAAQQFMPGIRLARTGPIRQCQGMLLVEWLATGPDGQRRGAGTNVFALGADGLIAAVTGFWQASA
jgi:uncharacterized protein YndB with AHSA1/START domain